MTTLYLIRHAEAEGNVFRRLQGQYDAMITPNGMKQIAALQKRFESIPVDAVYASDLTRTCTTAAAIYRAKNLPLHKDARFREIGCGVWENLPFGYLDHIDPERNRDFTRRPRQWQVEGSEHFEDYTHRFLEAMEEVARRHEGGTAAIFSHGMVMRGVIQSLFFPEKENLGHSENTAVTKLRWENGTYTLEYLNDASHLPEEITTLGRQMWWRGGKHTDFNMWYRDPTPEDFSMLASWGIPAELTVRISVLVDRAIGAVALRLPEGDTAQLAGMYLLPEYRGKGFSAQLLGEAISVARTAGKQNLILSEAMRQAPSARKLIGEYGLSEEPFSLIPTVR